MSDLHEVDAERRADVALDIIDAAARDWNRKHRRPPALKVRDVLAVLPFELTVFLMVAAKMRDGEAPNDADIGAMADSIAVVRRLCEESVGEVFG